MAKVFPVTSLSSSSTTSFLAFRDETSDNYDFLRDLASQSLSAPSVLVVVLDVIIRSAAVVVFYLFNHC